MALSILMKLRTCSNTTSFFLFYVVGTTSRFQGVISINHMTSSHCYSIIKFAVRCQCISINCRATMASSSIKIYRSFSCCLNVFVGVIIYSAMLFSWVFTSCSFIISIDIDAVLKVKVCFIWNLILSSTTNTEVPVCDMS